MLNAASLPDPSPPEKRNRPEGSMSNDDGVLSTGVWPSDVSCPDSASKRKPARLSCPRFEIQTNLPDGWTLESAGVLRSLKSAGMVGSVWTAVITPVPLGGMDQSVMVLFVSLEVNAHRWEGCSAMCRGPQPGEPGERASSMMRPFFSGSNRKWYTMFCWTCGTNMLRLSASTATERADSLVKIMSTGWALRL